MSPEQALNQTNDVDIRSDVYSLGVVLFELLTGSTPRSNSSSGSLSAGWAQETFWADDPRAPSHWAPNNSARNISPEELRGELDWMTLKALARHSDDRYQTVADFQRDLEGFLAGEPVEAAGPSWTYRVAKLIRRNRVAAVASSLVLVTVVATSIVTSWFAIRASRAETDANDRLDEVLAIQQELESERDSADQARRQAETMLRVFQVQTATGRALAAHYQSVFSNPQLQGDPETVQRFASELQTSILLEPHARLIVRGDWHWASESFPDEIMLDPLKLSSKDVAAELPIPPPSSPSMDPTTAGTAKGEPIEGTIPTPTENSTFPSFRVRLLDELKKVVGADDPFIAEVLDNSGLDAMARGELEEAERHLRDASGIWRKSDRHLANLVQSKLFFAEALLKQAKLEEARTVLQEAQKLIGTLPADGPHTKPLEAFLQELSAG